MKSGQLNAAGFAALAVLLLTLPFVLSSYHVFQATMVIVYAVALLGLNLLIGYNGQISLGHGAFFAIGAYTTSILVTKVGMPYWVTVPIAGILSLVVGFLFGLPALRLEGPYLALPTFALAVATPQLLNFDDVAPLTGGVQGIMFDKPESPLLSLDQDQWLYFFCLAIAAPLYIIGGTCCARARAVPS